ncbi:hypothetical protein LYNGBM3L_64740 [Moorena producens 3L]|uniref:Uncharacterized protein n=1 Tax=Moorena producens 3L TaxID=489825 RepID=F4Y1T9_9CYAN|nr:hypothetical protein LYNGBM3L_64740 [Moorena producens 3L]
MLAQVLLPSFIARSNTLETLPATFNHSEVNSKQFLIYGIAYWSDD